IIVLLFTGVPGTVFLLILARIPPSHWGATPRQPDAPGIIRHTGPEDAEARPNLGFYVLVARPVFNPRRGVAKPITQITSQMMPRYPGRVRRANSTRT